MNAEIGITVNIYPTEVDERIKKAILDIFPDADINVGESVLTAKAKDLETLAEKLRDQRIRATARSILRRCASQSEIRFYLNKQAAFMGKVNFTEGESVLGDIEVSIHTEEPDTLIDSLTLVEKKEDLQ